MGNKKYSIGVFDSGFGGLDILRHIVKELPQYNYIYLGDTARTPYGGRSQETIFTFTTQAVDFLFKNNCGLIILACNTASSGALRRIQQEYLPKYYPKRRVLGVIIPTAEEAVKMSKGRIGVIATEGSVASGAFVRELKKLDSHIRIFQQACPLLVPLVEAHEENSLASGLILKNYLQPLIRNNIDALILGCTHYGILENKIRKIVGNKITVINEGGVVGRKLKDYLYRHPEIEQSLSKESKVRFFTTDLTDKFKSFGSKFFGKNILPEKVELK
jgi:glutamate racemase